MNMDSQKLTKYDEQYHDRQFVEPYQSTIGFCDWLHRLGATHDGGSGEICDLGCGKGASTYYMSRRFAGYQFHGLDIDEQLIRDGNNFLVRAEATNCRLVVGDLYNASKCFEGRQFDGVVSLQTLSWLPGYEAALDAILALSPNWIALSSLFFDGLIEAKTVITDFESASHDSERRGFYYNTYSLPLVRKYLLDQGYKRFESLRFEMPIDLPRTAGGKMGTYTERMMDGSRLQISGPLLMNWYFIYAAKN